MITLFMDYLTKVPDHGPTWFGFCCDVLVISCIIYLVYDFIKKRSK